MNGLRGGFAGTSSSSRPCVAAQRPSLRPARPTAGRTAVIMAGNSATSGPFAPLVRATRGVVGQKDFNKFRGKAISLHSQVIKEFCGVIGADGKQAQAVIRLAKKNGEWLGFLA